MISALNNNDASWIRDLWIGSFTGICGSALLWDNMHRRELWPHFGRLRAFVAGYDFDESGDNQHKGWTNENDLRGDNLAEMMCLRNWEDNNKQAIGVIANRTYNFFTQAEGSPCNSPDNIADIYESTINIGPIEDFSNPSALMSIPKMGSMVRYNIEYFNVMNGEFLKEYTKIRSDINGELYLPYPQISGSAKCPIVLFKVYKWKNRSMLEYNDSIVKHTDVSNKLSDYIIERRGVDSVSKLGIKVFPNPANDVLNVEYSGLQTESIVQIFTADGRLMVQLPMTGQNLQILLNQLATGIYIVIFQNNEETYHEKFIKN